MNRIDSIRAKKAMSYGDLAKASGLTSAYIHLLAKGKRNNPSFEVMQKLSQALGEKVEKVFKMN
ncbi:MAG: helix-turn-helix transcriptional regulator [Clostridiaceae bacterium]|nr:helix-turn-helix transcriptional regulator [Clostridiaceae bacterium]